MIKHDVVRLLATQKIAAAITKMGQSLTEDEIYKALVEPPNSEMGDLAFGCFTLAKALKKGPPQISAEIAQNIVTDSELVKAQAAGPYLNLTFSPQALGEKVVAPILDGSFFKKQILEKSPKTMIEYSQPNTHKELHVGHMRNLCLGDALVRMLRYSGREIISSTFPGDMGTHVAKCLWYMKKHNHEPVPAKEKGEWLGRMYSKANLLLEDQNGTPQEEINRAELTEILKQLESGNGPYYDLWKETREWSIALMKSVYKWANVEFDEWYFESDMDTPSASWVKDLYAQGKLEKSNGAIGMNLESENLGFCMLLKSDGTGLYATKDLLLAKHKFEDRKIEKSVYVVDMRQALHFKQVFRVLEILGFEQAKNCFHLQYNYVELPDGAMSSRKGNIIPLSSLVHSMEGHVKATYLSRYENEWSKEEIETVAGQVAKGAIFYGMLRMDTNKKIVFDMNEWLKLDGESGPFIQYSHARIASLGRKFPRTTDKVDWSQLSHASERQLMQAMFGFNTSVAQASENFKPAAICTYLYELAKKFNVFYHECPIGMEKDEATREARLALAAAVGATLKQGMSVLGMPAPDKM
ncbi:arginine--tRNA ligase [Bdellovibrio svalbardensis]|uniref:Arginine--tRNA ligase n=1 Tax=Bdellovibrio svalbardensis TaxID=2972972 RepID=A0ABT6DIB7_9BACT|nr:arginine--tRNA ligase [Bdellovibrio svalbardensis]MDG0816584.1 arginine--tRNA ligase [Bdellovibrio svalbardensis]